MMDIPAMTAKTWMPTPMPKPRAVRIPALRLWAMALRTVMAKAGPGDITTAIWMEARSSHESINAFIMALYLNSRTESTNIWCMGEGVLAVSSGWKVVAMWWSDLIQTGSVLWWARISVSPLSVMRGARMKETV